MNRGIAAVTVLTVVAAMTVPVATAAAAPPAAPAAAPPAAPPAATEVLPGPPAPASPAPASAVPGLMIKYEPNVVAPLAEGQPVPGAAATSLELTAGAPMGLGWYSAVLPEPVSPQTAEDYARRLESDPAIVAAEPQGFAQPAQAVPAPNDPLWNQQWGFASYGDANFVPPFGDTPLGPEITGTNLLPALGADRGSAPVVAVIDSGITNHPDLGGRILPGYNFISYPAVAGNSEGRGPDASDPGDWVTPEMAASLPFSLGIVGCTGVTTSTWHGTLTAGTIAAVTDNGIGMAGTLPVQIQPLRVLGHCGGTWGDIGAAMVWAAGGSVPGVPDNPTPARVVNISLGAAASCPQYLQDAVDFGRSRGAVYVAAAGNRNADVATGAPANCDGVISVAATDENGSRASFSNYGDTVDVAAPGMNILTTYNQGLTTPGAPTYAAYSGTSPSAAFVSGALALLLAKEPALTVDQIEARLKSSATPFKQSSTYRNPAIDCVDDDPCGAGYLNTAALVGQATAPAPVVAPRFQVRPAAGADAPAGASPADVTPLDGEVDLTITWQPPRGTVTDYRVVIKRGDSVLAERDTAATNLTVLVPGDVDDAFDVTVVARRGGVPGVATAAMPVPSVVSSVPAAPQIMFVSAADTKATVLILADYAVPEVTSTVVEVQPGGGQCEVRVFPTWGTCEFDGLTPGVEYTFTAVVRNDVGDSARSGPYTATPEAFGGPTAPGIPTVVMQGTTATLSWTPAIPADGREIDSYIVAAQPSIGPLESCRVSRSWTDPLTTCQLGNLIVGQTYRFTVTAFDDLGKSSESGESLPVRVIGTATVPSAPDEPPGVFPGDRGVYAALGKGAISLFNGGAEMIAMRILASPGGASCDIPWDDVMAGLISGRGSGCVIEGLTNGQPYTFTTVGVNAMGVSPPSNASTPHTPEPSGSVYEPLAAPVRAFDSRQQGGPIAPDTPVTVNLQQPPDAVAVAYNVTVTGTTSAGNAVVGPTDADLSGTSTINWFAAGQTFANGYVSKLAFDGDLQVIVRGGSAQVIVDILGYYVPTGVGNVVVEPSAGAAAATGPAQAGDRLLYVPLDPGTRVYDSRTSDGPLRAGNSRTVDLATAAPDGASAVAYSITEFDTVGSGHLSVGLPGQPKPATSVINWFADGQRLANSTVATLDGQRAIEVFGGGTATGFAIDVLGYFTTPDRAPDGLRFQPISPARAYDSRDPGAGGLLLAGQRRTTSAAPRGQVAPLNAEAVAANLTVADTLGIGHLRVAPGDTAVRPDTSAINWFGPGQRLANGTTMTIRDGKMTTFNGSGATQYLVDIAGYYYKRSY